MTASVATQPVETLQAHIRQVTVSGDGCPVDSYLASVSPDEAAFTVAFSSVLAGGAMPVSSTCQVTIEMDIPDGHQMGNSPAYLCGKGMKAQLWRSYAFASSADPSKSFTSELDAGSYQLNDHAVGVWSPTCGASRSATLVATFNPTVHDADGVFQLDSFDGDVRWRGGADWRRCGDARVLDASPGKAGEFCGGAHNRSCESGLGCEYSGTPTSGVEGTCVDPHESLPPAAKGAYCGGLRNGACQEGLTCWHANQQAVDQKWRGWCEPLAAGPDDPCDEGVPALSCASGLFCLHGGLSNLCVSADGNYDSRCGDGLPACHDGLACNGAYCVHPPVGEGASCGGPEDVPCQKPLACKKAAPGDANGVCAAP